LQVQNWGQTLSHQKKNSNLLITKFMNSLK
jgi:hypothetical protein